MNYWGLFLAGLTDSYNPCSIGVLLISLTILVGLGKRKLITIFGIAYLSTIFVTYLLIGLGFLKAVHLFGIHGFFGYIAAVILIVVGLAHLAPTGIKKLPIFNWLNRCHIPTSLSQQIDKGVFLAGVILGFLIGLCTVPCAGGIYLGAIALLAAKLTYWQGVLGIFIFNIGFIIPLLIIFILSSRQAVLDKIKLWNVKITAISQYLLPIIMIMMGIILLWLTMK